MTGAVATRGYVSIEDIGVHYEIRGEGEPLVLLHGAGLDNRMWDRQFARFAEEYRVLRLDLPGFGWSLVPEHPFSAGEVLGGLLWSLELESAHVVGLSMGACVAVDFAIRFPELVRSLVLAAPGLGGYSWPEATLRRFTDLFRVAQTEGAAAAAERWLRDPCLQPAMERPELRDLVRRIHLENAHAWIDPIPMQPLEPPASERLGEVAARTLVLVGERDLPEMLEISGILERGIPGARREVVPRAGHLLNLEVPELFEASVLRFLRGG